ncbi:tetratricopeptide repeat protein [Pararhodospirillum oryzae]|uniref:protein O-GlcNAc transferase n=1 Tax=Pararhodospirillum oryzae TaxID=478448 RepID=A0A512H7V3_9PROT|nr:glycosyltransferase family 41 protein [Pararhodospirillum oryzae]GEO81539.1 hypothetical protein ROR02_16700 [Pararhodospirillum oryzae]
MSTPLAHAITLYRAGDFLGARNACVVALHAAPRDPEILAVLGLSALRLGRAEEAAQVLRASLDLRPDLMVAVNLGHALLSLGRLDESREACALVIRLAPRESIGPLNLGAVLSRLGRPAEALAAFRHALALAPALRDAWYNSAVCLQEQERFQESLAPLRRALVLEPENIAALTLFGLARHRTGAFVQAINQYRTVLALEPTHETALNNHAAALFQLNRPRAAVAAYERVLRACPANPMALNNMALALNRIGQTSRALTAWHRALALQPDGLDAWINLGGARKDMGTHADARRALRRAQVLNPKGASLAGSLLFLMNGDPTATAQAQGEAHRAWARRHADPLSPPRRRLPAVLGRRVRVGYVSPDLWTHSVAYFFEPLLEAHDRGGFEIFCYSDTRAPDATTARLQALAEHWRVTCGLPDETFAAQVQADGIDILVDLAGHTAENRLLAFARRPAPVQVTWLGYPNTTGLAAMDWRISDIIADPAPASDLCHSERLMRLAGGFLCYRPPLRTMPVGPAPCLASGAITFGSFNALSKLNGSVLATWAGLLHRLPSARLCLKGRGLGDPVVARRFAEAFAAQGVDPARLVALEQTQGIEDHFALYNQIDIGLDPFPYNGTTTTCEALWMGIPVVTLLGTTHAGRVGASLLGHLGHPELIAADREGYIETALDLARDPARLDALRQGLRGRLEGSSLCDAKGFARRLEAAFREMLTDASLPRS